MNAGPPVISGWDLAASDSSGQNYCGSASPTSVPRARRRELSCFRLLYLVRLRSIGHSALLSFSQHTRMQDAVSRRGTIPAREHQCIAFSKDASVRSPSRYAQQPIYLLLYTYSRAIQPLHTQRKIARSFLIAGQPRITFRPQQGFHLPIHCRPKLVTDTENSPLSIYQFLMPKGNRGAHVYLDWQGIAPGPLCGSGLRIGFASPWG